MRLRLRTNSLCLTCFFALINTSLSRPVLFAPAYERLVAVAILDRARGPRTAPPLARGIFELAAAAAAGRDNVNADEEVAPAAAARCVPSLAMMREREMRGFRGDGNCPFDVDAAVIVRLEVDAEGNADDEWPAVAGGRSGLRVPPWTAVARVVAAAAREVGFVGGGITARFWLGDSNSGVVNILSPGGEPAFPPPRRELFVMASRTALCGGVFARCAMIALVLDLVTVGSPVGLRIFARELAVGANSLDVDLVGLKMEAFLETLLPPLPPLSLSILLLPPLVPSATVPANSSQGARLVDADEREMPTPSFMALTL